MTATVKQKPDPARSQTLEARARSTRSLPNIVLWWDEHAGSRLSMPIAAALHDLSFDAEKAAFLVRYPSDEPQQT